MELRILSPSVFIRIVKSTLANKRKLWLGLFVAVVLIQCSDDNLNEPTTLPPVTPTLPLPALTCSNFIQYGYPDKQSYSPGETIKIYIQSTNDCPSCRLDILNIDRSLAFAVTAKLKIQNINQDAPYANGYGFDTPVEFVVPSTLASGIYLAGGKIPILIKSKSLAEIVVVYPSNTVNAYNSSGGKSLYTPPPDRPYLASFLRPMDLQGNATICLQWLYELKDISISYITDSDMDEYKNIAGNKLLMIIGHSEYWTRDARINFDRFVEQKGNVLILSGNTMWWQVRYQNDKTKVVCYKEGPDPVADPLLKTINWDHPILNFPIVSSIGADFPRGGYGLTNDQGWDGYKIASPQSPLLHGLNKKKGDIIRLPSGEYDGAPLAGKDADGYPVLDNTLNNFYKIELVGYDKGSRFNRETIGTFIVLQKKQSSGIIINTASYDWCSSRGMGGADGQVIKTITWNAIQKLLKDQPVFSN